MPRALTLLLVVASCACISPRILERGRVNERAVAEVERDVERQRELPFLRPVPLEVKKARELGEQLKAWYDANQEALAVEDALYHRLGVLPADQSLSSVYSRFYVAFAGGIYERQGGGRMILVQDYAPWSKVQQDMIGLLTGKDWAYELFLAHELVHALQDQHYGLSTLVPDELYAHEGDEALARKTLLESEAATLGMAHFFGMDLRGPVERKAFFAYLRFNNLLNGPLLAVLSGKTPSFFSKQTFGQYELGLDRVERLLDAGGWDAVSRSYLRPPGHPLGLPESTEQLLFPEKLAGPAHDPPVRLPRLQAAPAAMPEAEVLRSNVFGALLFRLYLEGFVPGFEAHAAAAGWGGDRYELLRDGDAAVFVWRTTWDSEADAEEAALSLSRAVQQKYAGRATALADDGRSRDGVEDARAFAVAPSTEGSAGVPTTRPEVAAVVRRGRDVVLVDGARPEVWRPLAAELLAATTPVDAAPDPGREERARALEARIAEAPDAGARAPSVQDRLVLPRRTLALRVGVGAAMAPGVDDVALFPDLELRWGVRRGIEWTLPFLLTSTHRSPLGRTAVTAGLVRFGLGLATGGPSAEGLLGLLHALPVGERLALVAQGQARLHAVFARADEAELSLSGALALSSMVLDRLVLSPGIGFDVVLPHAGASLLGDLPIERRPGLVVLGSALRRGLFQAPLVELQLSDMLHLYESSRLFFDPTSRDLVLHEHTAGVLVYF